MRSFDIQIMWPWFIFLKNLKNASQMYRQTWEVAIKHAKKIFQIITQYLIFLEEKTSNKVCSGNPQATLYVDCSNQQNTRSLAKLGNFYKYDFRGKTTPSATSSVCQTQTGCSLLACVPFYFHLTCFSQTDLVVMFSIGKYISLTLEYLWSVYFQ